MCATATENIALHQPATANQLRMCVPVITLQIAGRYTDYMQMPFSISDIKY